MPIVAGTMYMSAADSGATVGAGVFVGPSPTARYVKDCDGPYALEPAKLASIW